MYTAITGSPDEGVRQPARIEPLPGRARIARLSLEHRRAERLEPGDRIVQPPPDEPLKRLVAARALVAEVFPLAVAPDDTARQEHRPARTIALLVDDRRRAELARPGRRGQSGH